MRKPKPCTVHWGRISMANNGNLRPFNTLTPEQRREISRKGGKASGAARRKKRERVEQELAERTADLLEMQRTISLLLANSKALAAASGNNGRSPRSRHKHIYRC